MQKERRAASILTVGGKAVRGARALALAIWREGFWYRLEADATGCRWAQQQYWPTKVLNNPFLCNCQELGVPISSVRKHFFARQLLILQTFDCYLIGWLCPRIDKIDK